MTRLCLVAVACVIAVALFPTRAELRPAPGVLAAQSPRQSLISAAPVRLQSFTLAPLARFEGDARVLARRDYADGAESELSPTDLALGWGRMSDSRVLDAIEIRQASRWFHFSYRRAPIPHDEIVRSSANMHFIPATPLIAATLAAIRPGDVISFRGALVNATRRDGWRWHTSLSRDDTGAGSCELVYLESLAVR